MIRALLNAIGIDIVGVADHEAGDVIATWSKLATGTVEIASGDRDLFALVENPRVRILYPDRSGLTVIDEDEVKRRYGIPGRRIRHQGDARGTAGGRFADRCPDRSARCVSRPRSSDAGARRGLVSLGR